VEIWNVTPGSPADAAGIKKGDEVLSVDDQSVTSTTFRRFDSMMEGPEGSTVKIVVSRKGEVMRFELKRVFLINEAGA
jgi:carboxyl-terminal processing protease